MMRSTAVMWSFVRRTVRRMLVWIDAIDLAKRARRRDIGGGQTWGVGMDPVGDVGVHLIPSLDCWCFRDPIDCGSQWGIVRSVGTDRVSGGIVWGRNGYA